MTNPAPHVQPGAVFRYDRTRMRVLALEAGMVKYEWDEPTRQEIGRVDAAYFINYLRQPYWQLETPSPTAVPEGL